MSDSLSIGIRFSDSLIDEEKSENGQTKAAKLLQTNLFDPLKVLKQIVENEISVEDGEKLVNEISLPQIKDLGLAILESKKQPLDVVVQETEEKENSEKSEAEQKLADITSFFKYTTTTLSSIKMRSEPLDKCLSKLNQTDVPEEQFTAMANALIEMNKSLTSNYESENDPYVLRIYKKTSKLSSELDFIEEFDVEYSDEGDNVHRLDDIERTIDIMYDSLIKQNEEIKNNKKDADEIKAVKQSLTDCLKEGEQLIDSSNAKMVISGLDLCIKREGRLEDRFRSFFAAFGLMNSYITKSNNKTRNTLILYSIVVFVIALITYFIRK